MLSLPLLRFCWRLLFVPGRIPEQFVYMYKEANQTLRVLLVGMGTTLVRERYPFPDIAEGFAGPAPQAPSSGGLAWPEGPAAALPGSRRRRSRKPAHMTLRVCVRIPRRPVVVLPEDAQGAFESLISSLQKDGRRNTTANMIFLSCG